MEFKGEIKKSGGEFRSPGDGVHVMGLVSIKDCVKKFNDEERPGIQFTFKAAADPDAMVCHRVTTSLNPKSSLYKTLRRMVGKTISEATTGEEAKAILEKLEDRWYEVTVVEAPAKDGRIFANVDECLITPCPADRAPADKPSVYFAKAKPKPSAAAPADDKAQDNLPF